MFSHSLRLSVCLLPRSLYPLLFTHYRYTMLWGKDDMIREQLKEVSLISLSLFFSSFSLSPRPAPPSLFTLLSSSLLSLTHLFSLTSLFNH